MNRAAAERAAGIKSKGDLRTLLTSSYYPPATRSRLGIPVSGAQATALQGLIAQALGGSNKANFSTGNESGNVGYASRAAGKWMPIPAKGGYERFVGEPWTKAWVQQKQAEEALAKTTMLKGLAAANTNPYGVKYKGLRYRRHRPEASSRT